MYPCEIAIILLKAAKNLTIFHIGGHIVHFDIDIITAFHFELGDDGKWVCIRYVTPRKNSVSGQRAKRNNIRVDTVHDTSIEIIIC